MADITGTVTCIQVGDDFAFTTINDGAGDSETFILWLSPGSNIPPAVNAYTRVMHSMWISMLREAKANNLTVRVASPSNSAAVSFVQLGT